jgi:speckle-type POZ protein
MLRSPGFDKLMPLEEFTDDCNGYVVDDTCVFGAEVFVCKERTKGKRERLLRIDNAVMYKQVWKVENFSKLDAPYYESEPFNAGDQKWYLSLAFLSISFSTKTKKMLKNFMCVEYVT